nr:futalosine hydrolase [Thermodesulfovibrio sp.]
MKKELKKKSENSIGNLLYTIGKLGKYEIVLCITGIGKVNAAISSTIAFQNLPIKKALISGIAGAYPNSGLNIGEIVVAQKEINADEGLLRTCNDHPNSFLFLSIEEINLEIPQSLRKLKKGTFLTVSSCTGNLKRANFLERKFNAVCENMEGFAIAKAAQYFNIPTMEIRAISNFVKSRRRLLSPIEIKKASEIMQKFIIENISSLMV